MFNALIGYKQLSLYCINHTIRNIYYTLTAVKTQPPSSNSPFADIQYIIMQRTVNVIHSS